MQMKTEQTSNDHEMLSALADGQLRGTAFARAVDAVLHDDDAQATWHRYHLIGDVMRSGELAQCDGDSAFLARLQTRLKQEPGFARPATVAEVAEVAMVASGANGVVAQERAAANEAGFRWKMVAGFASMAAVAAIGWNLLNAPGAGPAASQQLALVPAPVQVAKAAPADPTGGIMQVAATTAAPAAPITAQAVTLASGEPQVMIRDRRLDELMAAHKQFGGTSALQKPAGVLRNATFEGPSR
jgi:sigma-E factor negative regulatory protein RseA